MYRAIRALALVLCASACVPVHAQAYPAKAVRLVYPILPGGAMDQFMRLVSQQLAEGWAQPVVIENKPGAATILGTEHVVRSAPDGYTLLVSSPNLVINLALQSKLPYDTFTDLVPVTQLIAMNQMVVVNATVPVKNLKDLIELAKAKPGGLSYASYGIGSSAHLSMELLQSMAGIKLNHVPYKGGAQALADVVAGHVQITYGTFGTMASQWKAGKVRVLAVDGVKRLVQYPDFPTVSETLPGYESRSWLGLHAPAETPREVVQRIAAQVGKTLAEPAFRKKNLDPWGIEPVASAPEQFAEFVKAQAVKWGRIVREANVQAH